MIRRSAAIVCMSLALGACWDFVEPDFPGAGAPAVLTVGLFADESNRANVTGLLAPGLTKGGLQRRVTNDTLWIYGVPLTPTNVRPNGSREYDTTLEAPDLENRVLEVRPPAIEELTSPAPTRWSTIRKLDPDTISWTRGTDLVLRIDTTLVSVQPRPQIRQWFLELRGSDRPFRVSSDGLPPAALRIPAEWMPTPSSSGTIVASLQFYQSGQQLSAPRDFLTNVTFTFILRWIIRVNPS